jgi:hypothetical protein
MDSVNVNVSVTNLPQIDRHQNDIHKNPIVSQDVNAKIIQGENEHKMQMPVQTAAADGKNVDPKQKREEAPGKKKSQKISLTRHNEKKGSDRHGDDGFLVDIDA